jgi:hypothetical protein
VVAWGALGAVGGWTERRTIEASRSAVVACGLLGVEVAVKGAAVGEVGLLVLVVVVVVVVTSVLGTAAG